MRFFKKEYSKNYYDDIIFDERIKSRRNEIRLKKLLKFKTNGKLLEIGCGKGSFLLKASKYFDVEGIEISEYVAEKDKETIHLHINAGDIEKIKLKPKEYDVIVVFNIFEHLKSPEKTIKKLHNSLKKDGILIGSIPNNSGVIGRTITKIYNMFDKTHCSTFRIKKWTKVFENTGFERVGSYGEIPLGRNNCLYLKSKLGQLVSWNYVFIYRKSKE